MTAKRVRLPTDRIPVSSLFHVLGPAVAHGDVSFRLHRNWADKEKTRRPIRDGGLLTCKNPDVVPPNFRRV
jgi:hypothetical protein